MAAKKTSNSKATGPITIRVTRRNAGPVDGRYQAELIRSDVERLKLEPEHGFPGEHPALHRAGSDTAAVAGVKRKIAASGWAVGRATIIRDY